MHELAVTESILKIALDHANQANATHVTGIFLVIGRLSSIVDDSVQFYWDIISRDTLCAGAQLNFQRIPARLSCFNCSGEYVLEGELTPCPTCGSHKVKVISGTEFQVESIEVLK